VATGQEEVEIALSAEERNALYRCITVSGLEHAPEEHFQRGFSNQYVSKIADKVSREGLIEMDRCARSFSRSSTGILTTPRPEFPSLSLATASKPKERRHDGPSVTQR
jgi:hypothetical protein